jgi:UDP-glucose:glycoprotein glucosyltransferase
MTHEPKLARAKRLIPEWTVYDEEIAALARKLQESDALSEFETIAQKADELGQAVEQKADQQKFESEQDASHESGQHRVKDEL